MNYIYPIVLSLIPAFHLYLNNRVPIKYAYPSWIMIGIVMGALIFLLNSLTKSQEKAGVIGAALAIGFFYFELILQQLGSVSFILGITHKETDLQYATVIPLLLFIFWFFLWLNAARIIIRSDPLMQKTKTYLIVVSLALTISPLLGIGKIILNTAASDKPINNTFTRDIIEDLENEPAMYQDAGHTKPDIYYLIFDGFGGSEILTDMYDTDILEFIDQLEQRGFYVAAGSKPNYSQTICSLPSSLNLTYLDEISRDLIDPNSWGPLVSSLQENLVANYLDLQDYDLVTFSSGFWPTENVRSDIKYSPLINLNEYQEVLLLNTPIVRIYPGILYDIHRNRITFTLNKLKDLEGTDNPKFVFSHIYSPHPPFVFNEEGNPIHPQRSFNKYDADGFRLKGGTSIEYAEFYSGQLNYLLEEILIMVDEILSESKSPPILIIQGDHGPGSTISQHQLDKNNLDERFSIMNAYYFPNQEYDLLYPEITPVNTFRTIFNQFFEADLSLLPDRNYFSTVFEPYKFFDMTEVVK